MLKCSNFWSFESFFWLQWPLTNECHEKTVKKSKIIQSLAAIGGNSTKCPRLIVHFRLFLVHEVLRNLQFQRKAGEILPEGWNQFNALPNRVCHRHVPNELWTENFSFLRCVFCGFFFVLNNYDCGAYVKTIWHPFHTHMQIRSGCWGMGNIYDN